MAQQEEARVQRNIAKNQQAESNLQDPAKLASFMQSFATLKHTIDSKMNQLKADHSSIGNVKEELDNCALTLQTMTTLLHNTVSYLPQYEARHAQQVILRRYFHSFPNAIHVRS